MQAILDNSSIIIFVISYKLSGNNIMIATWAVIVASVVLTIIAYFLGRKLSTISYISTVLLIVMGLITIISGDVRFIKMKPTLINGIFAFILFLGCYKGQGLIKYIFQGTIEMNERNWIIFSKRFGIYFFSLAILNELIWRNYSEEFWVNFKLFGMLPLSFIFICTQIPFLLKHKINIKNDVK